MSPLSTLQRIFPPFVDSKRDKPRGMMFIADENPGRRYSASSRHLSTANATSRAA